MWSMVGSWREVIKACMEGIIFVLGSEELPVKKRRMAVEILVSRGTEL